MSLLDTKETIKFPLYYEEKKTKGGISRYFPLEDEEAKKRINENKKLEVAHNESQKDKDEKKPFVLPCEKKVHILNTEWKVLNWREQNDIQRDSMFKDFETNQSEIDFIKLRDQFLKKCLISWDLKDDKGNLIPYKPYLIDNMPFEIVYALVRKYDELTAIGEEDEKK